MKIVVVMFTLVACVLAGTEWMPGMKPVNPGPKCPVDCNEICDYEFECATECFNENGCLYVWGKRSDESLPPFEIRDEASKREPLPPFTIREASKGEPLPPFTIREEASKREPLPPFTIREEASKREPLPPFTIREEASKREPLPQFKIRSEADAASKRDSTPAFCYWRCRTKCMGPGKNAESCTQCYKEQGC